MRYLFVLALAGCAMQPIDQEPGNTCVSRAQFAGDKIRHLETQRIGTIRRVYGPSARCTDSAHPNMADVEY